jgi:hypothetical protein
MAPTRGDFKTSPGRYSGQDNGWIGPVIDAFWEEMKTHPNIPYKPFGAGSYEAIPPAYRWCLPPRFSRLADATRRGGFQGALAFSFPPLRAHSLAMIVSRKSSRLIFRFRAAILET